MLLHLIFGPNPLGDFLAYVGKLQTHVTDSLNRHDPNLPPYRCKHSHGAGPRFKTDGDFKKC